MSFRYVLPLLVVIVSLHPSAHAQDASWQQRVSYDIDIRLDTDSHRMDGRQVVRYENNSPDTLDRVFFHLYVNAFHPESMMAERNRVLPDPDSRIVPRIFNLGPDEIGFHRIESIRQDGTPVAYRITDTVMEVKLAHPIAPGAATEFELEYHSQVPLQTRRSGRHNREGIDYSMSQWYPKIAAYDRRGWHADPYVGREFYAPFGTFDVRITLPSEYVVAATGVLQNAEEIGHGYTERPVSVESETLTWHFRAENVHDFAWAADPDYIHDVIESATGITVHLFYQPDVAEVWQNLRTEAPAIMDFFSENYGRYPYPQMTVAQAGDGGMEYPMITFVTGRRSPASLRGVTAHEMAHMWYYGVLGSNEADFAWMDEGFGSYITTEVTGHLTGNPSPSHASSALGVLQAHHYGLFEPMNTPSDWFRTNYGYSIAAYTAGEMLLDLLGYVMSDPVRDQFLQTYFERFRFRHPDPTDVEKVAEDVSGLQLDWFFAQFTETDWTLDYAVRNVDSRRSGAAWRADITLERVSDIAMPIDVLITLDDGTAQWVTIPLGVMQGHKPVPQDWVVADPWLWTSPRYTLSIDLPARVRRVEIDPMLRTPDRNRLNNVTGLPTAITFLNAPQQRWTSYGIGWRPLAQYAHNWGIGAGLQARGTYIFGRWRTQAMLKLWPEVLFSGGDEPDVTSDPVLPIDGSPVDGIDYELRIDHPQRVFGTFGSVSLRSRKHLGIIESEARISALLGRHAILRRGQRELILSIAHQNRTSDRSLFTPVAAGFSSDDLVFARVGYRYENPTTRVIVGLETGGSFAPGFDFGSANRAYVDAAISTPVGPFTGVLHAQVGVGADNLVSQRLFRLGAASFSDRWGQDAYRTIGALVDDPWDDLHWVAFGGPGPIAYSLMQLPDFGGTSVVGAPSGSNIMAASARLVTGRLADARPLRPLRLELFFGVGEVWSNEFEASDLLYDAGFGLHYNVAELTILRRWVAQSNVLSGLQLTAQFPVWVSDPELLGGDEQLDFRWMLGIVVDRPFGN